MHRINLLQAEPCDTHSLYSCEPCAGRNHYDCDAPDASYAAGHIVDTAAYLEGWTTVAQCGDDEDDLSSLRLMLEAHGAQDDFDRGVRDALDAAYGEVREVHIRH